MQLLFKAIFPLELVSDGLRALAIALSIAAVPSAVHAQYDYERSTHGRLRDTSTEVVAEQALIAAGVQCRVVRSRLIGRDDAGVAVYEAGCSEGDAYTVIGNPENRAYDCLDLDAQSQAARGRSGGPAVRRCSIRPTRSLVQRARAYAGEAQLGCQVDEARSLGRNPEGMRLFEVGCKGEAGAWLEQTADGWKITDCLRVQHDGGACNFTDEQEKARTVQGWLVQGGEGGRCRVSHGAFLGLSRQGGLYEATCDGGGGFIVRRTGEGMIDGVYPCGADFGVQVQCRRSF